MTPIEKAVAIVGGPAKLAAILGKSAQAVCFWRDGKRKLPAELCARIEGATGGQVTRRDLRPNDWLVIWPELERRAPEATDDKSPEPIDRRNPASVNPFPDLDRRDPAQGAS